MDILGTIGDIVGVGANVASGGIVGAAIRLVPMAISTVAKIITSKADQAHELDMRKLDLQIAQQQGAQNLREIDLKGQWEEAGKTLDAWKSALDGQNQPSGVPWADALSKAVRPLTTYYFLAIYGFTKLAMFSLAIFDPKLTTVDALSVLWTSADGQMFFGLLGFWFVDRQLGKEAVAKR